MNIIIIYGMNGDVLITVGKVLETNGDVITLQRRNGSLQYLTCVKLVTQQLETMCFHQLVTKVTIGLRDHTTLGR